MKNDMRIELLYEMVAALAADVEALRARCLALERQRQPTTAIGVDVPTVCVSDYPPQAPMTHEPQ